MYPYIDFGIFQIPTYGCMVALGIVAFTLSTIYLFEKKGSFVKEQTDKLLLISLIGFLILGASAFVMNSVFHTIEDGKITIGGFTWLGGVLISFPISILIFEKYGKFTNLRGIQVFEYLMPGLIIAHCFGRIGCFLAGCCFGGPTDSIFGVSYPMYSEAFFCYPNDALTRSLPLWPTQLFEAGFELILYIILMLTRRSTKEYGLEIYCFSYGIFRFFLEYLRADDRGSTFTIFSPSQIMSIILIIYGVVLIILRNINRTKIYFK